MCIYIYIYIYIIEDIILYSVGWPPGKDRMIVMFVNITVSLLVLSLL